MSGAGSSTPELQSVDELIGEYLLYRGFSESFRCFALDRATDCVQGFNTTALASDIFRLLAVDLDIDAFERLWFFLQDRFFSQLDGSRNGSESGGQDTEGAAPVSALNGRPLACSPSEFRSTVAGLRQSLRRLFVVSAIQATAGQEGAGEPSLPAAVSTAGAGGTRSSHAQQRRRRRPPPGDGRVAVAEFFRRYSASLSRDEAWRPWFSLPFLSPRQAATDELFAPYFRRSWREALRLSLGNFLSSAFARLRAPRLLAFNLTAQRCLSLECALRAERDEVKRLRAEMRRMRVRLDNAERTALDASAAAAASAFGMFRDRDEEMAKDMPLEGSYFGSTKGILMGNGEYEKQEKTAVGEEEAIDASLVPERMPSRNHSRFNPYEESRAVHVRNDKVQAREQGEEGGAGEEGGGKQTNMEKGSKWKGEHSKDLVAVLGACAFGGDAESAQSRVDGKSSAVTVKNSGAFGHRQGTAVLCARFDGGGAMLASGGEDASLRVWALASADGCVQTAFLSSALCASEVRCADWLCSSSPPTAELAAALLPPSLSSSSSSLPPSSSSSSSSSLPATALRALRGAVLFGCSDGTVGAWDVGRRRAALRFRATDAVGRASESSASGSRRGGQSGVACLAIHPRSKQHAAAVLSAVAAAGGNLFGGGVGGGSVDGDKARLQSISMVVATEDGAGNGVLSSIAVILSPSGVGGGDGGPFGSPGGGGAGGTAARPRLLARLPCEPLDDDGSDNDESNIESPACVCLEFNHNGSLLVAGFRDGSVRVFDGKLNAALMAWRAVPGCCRTRAPLAAGAMLSPALSSVCFTSDETGILAVGRERDGEGMASFVVEWSMRGGMKAATEVKRCLLHRVAGSTTEGKGALPLPCGLALGGRRGEICAVGAGGAQGRGEAAPVLLFADLNASGPSPLELQAKEGSGEGEFASLERVCALDWVDTEDGERTSLVVAGGAGKRPLLVWSIKE